MADISSAYSGHRKWADAIRPYGRNPPKARELCAAVQQSGQT
jgi:hypothetical protein